MLFVVFVVHKRPQLVHLHRQSSPGLRGHLHRSRHSGVVGVHGLLEPAFTDLQAAGNPSQGHLFQQHPINPRFRVCSNPSPLRILCELSPTVPTFVILVALPSHSVLVNVIGSTGWTVQHGFNHSDQENNSAALFSRTLFSTFLPKWHYLILSSKGFSIPRLFTG